MSWGSLSLVMVVTLLGAFASLHLKMGSARTGGNVFTFFLNRHVALGVCLYCTSTILYLHLLSDIHLNTLYPLMSLTYVWVAVISKLFLGEKITFPRVFSTVLIIAGVLLILR
jgi:drug/metabolite transporter (DMT)-like permease